ncbi:hypothetical protein FEM48_Zijuj12G0159000 [Ziziphus jujuba var. spinosa]|uniref:Mechanosensitive ion channel MscS domain-containing protein n=1 Tax=Ziziphus jujuba var. spinosa TaxID=714518 RepID=A0A978UE92_ZIZJJ|nr:hypothetical protein FEM48_Zijuj12G0159000 [Ziziphus jujuba var. spinosa]
MAGVRFSILKSVYNSTKSSLKPQAFQSHDFCMEYVRPSYANVIRNYAKGAESCRNFINAHSQILGSQSLFDNNFHTKKPTSVISSTLSNSLFGRATPLVSVSSISKYCSYSSSSGGDTNRNGESGVPAASGSGEVDVGNDWVEKAKEVWQSALDVATYTGQKAKESSVELSPYVQHWLDSHPYLRNVIVPVGVTMTGTILAWAVMPRLLRRLHKYVNKAPAALLPGSVFAEQIPYERSLWGALEDPVRYLITFMVFSQVSAMVAPTTIASQYLEQAWRGAVILSFVWFLYRWKTNVFARLRAGPSVASQDRDKLQALDTITSVGLFVVGIMAFAEACGVAVQSILTVGGIGGVATAFAAKDILGNVLSGLSMQFSKPFSLGDTIKAGSIEGQVVEIGLITTSLLNAEKFPVIVPNSLFSSQVIVNKSRAEWRAIVNKIPLQINDLDKVPQISDDINSMLRSHPKVFLGKDAPYCFLSRIGKSSAELTIGCNLKHMKNKSELYSTEQDILLRSVQIIKQQGAILGSSFQDQSSE